MAENRRAHFGNQIMSGFDLWRQNMENRMNCTHSKFERLTQRRAEHKTRTNNGALFSTLQRQLWGRRAFFVL
jgi:hypothetical protein